jgi:hypothetical protein
MEITIHAHHQTSLMERKSLKSRPSLDTAFMGNHGDFNTSSSGKDIPVLTIRGKTISRCSLKI